MNDSDFFNKNFENGWYKFSDGKFKKDSPSKWNLVDVNWERFLERRGFKKIPYLQMGVGTLVEINAYRVCSEITQESMCPGVWNDVFNFSDECSIVVVKWYGRYYKILTSTFPDLMQLLNQFFPVMQAINTNKQKNEIKT